MEPFVIYRNLATLPFNLLRARKQPLYGAYAFFAVFLIRLYSVDLLGGSHDAVLVIEQTGRGR
jgi:hypothetical protein